MKIEINGRPTTLMGLVAFAQAMRLRKWKCRWCGNVNRGKAMRCEACDREQPEQR